MFSSTYFPGGDTVVVEHAEEQVDIQTGSQGSLSDSITCLYVGGEFAQCLLP